jgi:hypothetical protein
MSRKLAIKVTPGAPVRGRDDETRGGIAEERRVPHSIHGGTRIQRFTIIAPADAGAQPLAGAPSNP